MKPYGLKERPAKYTTDPPAGRVHAKRQTLEEIAAQLSEIEPRDVCGDPACWCAP